MMKKTAIVIIAILAISGSVWAQSDYKTSLGLRMGAAYGLTVKHFTSPATSWEGILSTRWNGFIITGLYQKNQNAFNNPNFNFYYGGGAHLGFWDLNNRSVPWERGDDVYDNDYVAIGIDGVIGLEYTFDEIPFCVALDWKPALNILQDPGFWVDHFGLSVRFVFPE